MRVLLLNFDDVLKESQGSIDKLLPVKYNDRLLTEVFTGIH